LRIVGTSVNHLVPAMALKILNKASGRTVVYSGDTAPSESLARFARGVNVLIHEASGPSAGHSSAAQAGWVAQRASVGKLYLIHYPILNVNLDALLADARREFSGQVELARDFDSFQF